MMDMRSKNQYLIQVRKEYLTTKSKKQRSRLLSEAEKRTGLARKYLIWKLKPKSNLDKQPEQRKKREQKYDSYVKTALVVCWKIFDYPCGQRLETCLKTEVDRLRRLKELRCSETVAQKLKTVSARTIDLKLKHQKEVERLNNKYRQKDNPLLYQKIPVKVSDEWDRQELGNIQIDLVEHCGQSAAGEFLNTLSSTDIATGWWEGEAVLGRGQLNTLSGLERIRQRFPFPWQEIHSDNGTEFINGNLYSYTKQESIGFSRSRPYKKNDNCFIEQKNKTHVKRFVGWLRYDTAKEQRILNDLYRNELRLFKNFFQPQIKLKEKIRIQGKVHRKHQRAQTPYHRIMACPDTPETTKQKLKQTYDNLNPAELKRAIDAKLKMLVEAYQAKNNSLKVKIDKKLTIRSVRNLIAQPELISVR